MKIKKLTSCLIFIGLLFVNTNCKKDLTKKLQTPPSNNNCSGAISLTSSTNCFYKYVGTLNYATASTDNPSGCESTGTHYDVWFTFVAVDTIQTILISSPESNFTNPAIQLYSGTCGSLSSVACGTTTLTANKLTKGITYFVRVSNVGTAPSSNRGFTICITHPPETPNTGNPVNTRPSANAGPDKMLVFPDNSCQLYGIASDNENNISSISWKKIAGPVNYQIGNPTSAITTISHLDTGIYQFEMTVVDYYGLTAKDTCNILVGEISSEPTTIILENRTWFLDWWSSINVDNFNTVVPPKKAFKAYIKRDGSSEWIEVAYHSTYFIGYYSINNTYLNIIYYGDDLSDTPDVKIEF